MKLSSALLFVFIVGLFMMYKNIPQVEKRVPQILTAYPPDRVESIVRVNTDAKLKDSKEEYSDHVDQNKTGNHTMLKANMKEVMNIIENIKNIDIDPRQLEIFQQYQQLKKDKNQNSVTLGFLNTFDEKLSVEERDRRLRERTNVVHPHPFKYVLNSPSICSGDQVFLLIYVHTSPGNYRRREVIRRTWGNGVQYKDVVVRIAFFMGSANESSAAKQKQLQENIVLEHEMYGDIVQEDFLDSYHNLTYKGVAALKWISLYCKHATFVLKTDDDIFVNMYSLINHFKHLQKDEENLRGLLMCAVWYGMPVLRTGKWKVSKEEWSGDYYPTYCSGSAFILTPDVAMILHEVSYHVPFFWVDDFYITGLLPLKAGNIVHRQFNSAYVLDGSKLEEYFTGPQWHIYVFSHLKDLNKILRVWNKLTKLAKREIMPQINKVLPGQLKS